MTLPSSTDGLIGFEDISEMRGKHCRDIFNCVKWLMPNDDDIVVRSDKVCNAIGKLVVNKVCGLDQITAEHLKYACSRIWGPLAVCFSQFLMHGVICFISDYWWLSNWKNIQYRKPQTVWTSQYAGVQISCALRWCSNSPFFRAYCTLHHTAHLWWSYCKAKMKRLYVAFNDAFRI